MNFIELTDMFTKEKILIGVDHIKFITPNNQNQSKFTVVGLGCGAVEVSETYDEIYERLDRLNSTFIIKEYVT